MSSKPRGGRGTNQYQVRGASRVSGPSAEVASALRAANDAELRAMANPGCLSEDLGVRIKLAEQGRPQDLGVLASDDSWSVREACLLYTSPSPRDS